MTSFLLWAGAGAVAALVTGRAAAHIVPSAALRRRNYRGLEVPTGIGVAALLGFAVGLGLVALVRAISDAPRVASAAGESVPFLAVGLGFGLLGLWDDVAAGPERGWRGHVGALRRGRATSGAVKVVGGAALALAVVAPRGEGFGWALVNAAVVALSANLFNLLDVRPGRAGKAFVLAAVPMLALGGPTAPALAAGLGALGAVLPADLRERGMLGDVGAMGLGAVIGCGIVALGTQGARLAALGLLVLLHLVAEGPTLSRGIERIPPLRGLDRLGRVPE